jgi:PIN domain nuclease of toxin-antitoxin system
MKLLLDTHLLLWAAAEPARLSAKARALIQDEANELWFSAVSVWEVSIKRALGRPDFKIDTRQWRQALLDNGYLELAVRGVHATALDGLPPLHQDPFDRMLVVQAAVENLTLLTADKLVAQYPGSIRKV